MCRSSSCIFSRCRRGRVRFVWAVRLRESDPSAGAAPLRPRREAVFGALLCVGCVRGNGLYRGLWAVSHEFSQEENTPATRMHSPAPLFRADREPDRSLCGPGARGNACVRRNGRCCQEHSSKITGGLQVCRDGHRRSGSSADSVADPAAGVVTEKTCTGPPGLLYCPIPAFPRWGGSFCEMEWSAAYNVQNG